ncbi:hypothetical protein ACLKA7_015267 [Drosophila subpalustris]
MEVADFDYSYSSIIVCVPISVFVSRSGELATDDQPCSYKIISFEINKLKPVGWTGNEGLCDSSSSYQLGAGLSAWSQPGLGLVMALAQHRHGDTSFSCISSTLENNSSHRSGVVSPQ